MPVRLVYSPKYRLMRANITRATRLAIAFAEQEIADDPSPRHHRRELPDGAIVDYSVQDVLIRYRRLSNEVVELERLLDLRTLP